jgi:beta-lactamase class D
MADDIADLFEGEQVIGTIVVASSDGSIVHVHNDRRARVRFSPASTFKILNTLIALDAGVIASRDSTFQWDGVDRGLTAWNRSQSVESAYRVSCVWCYQEIARSVGRGKYVSALLKAGFGNQTVGDSVDQFWLDGSLRISAFEQVEFLRKLTSNTLPYSMQHIDELKAIMLDERTSQYALYSKSGWTGPELHTGWYVGFVEAGVDTWLFAMNMRMDRADQASLRKQLVLSTLNILGII